jgi:hypothetical protein
LLAATFDLLNCSARAPAKQKNFRFLELTSSAFMVVAHSFNVPGDLRPLFGNDPRRLCVPPLKRFMEAGDGQVEQIEQIELLSWIERIKVRDCLQGKNMEALDILFADDVVSVEAVAMTGVQQEY